ncbi:hypothetical protein C366_03780 [Cryptococcus neoformans Tu401-1]|nr:hypothetical protein C366_03780 [Cryptococcus neoformans var. grubii Tu401-1]
MSDAQTRLRQFTTRAANASQIEQHAHAAYAVWAKGKSWEEFWCLFQSELNDAQWGKDALVTWVLVRTDDPEGEIYAGCKTYRRKGWVKHRGANDIEPGFVYDVTFVVTPKQHLRNGYANRLLSILHHHLAPSSTVPPIPEAWGKGQLSIPASPDIIARTPKAFGSILWSDIGSTYYARCAISPDRPGWIVDDSQNGELVWKILPPKDDVEKGFEWLYLEDLDAIGEELSDRLKEKLRQADTTERALFIQDPATPGILSYVPAIGARLSPTSQRLPVGLRIKSSSGNASEDTIVLITVTCIPFGERFLITFISNLAPAQLSLVLRACDKLATDAGHEEGWVWGVNGDVGLVKAWDEEPGREIKVGRRPEQHGHLLAVAWYGAEEEKGTIMESQIWSWG